MKRYLLFAGENYYPSGGIHDLYADFDDLSDAVDCAKKLTAEESGEIDWVHVFDQESNEIVFGNKDALWYLSARQMKK